jgi:hypothetical protein
MTDKDKLMIYIDECIKIFEDVEINVMYQGLHLSKESYAKNCIEKCERHLGIDRTFEACIHIDIMQGQSNQKAKEYLKQKKKGLRSIN